MRYQTLPNMNGKRVTFRLKWQNFNRITCGTILSANNGFYKIQCGENIFSVRRKNILPSA